MAFCQTNQKLENIYQGAIKSEKKNKKKPRKKTTSSFTFLVEAITTDGFIRLAVKTTTVLSTPLPAANLPLLSRLCPPPRCVRIPCCSYHTPPIAFYCQSFFLWFLFLLFSSNVPISFSPATPYPQSDLAPFPLTVMSFILSHRHKLTQRSRHCGPHLHTNVNTTTTTPLRKSARAHARTHKRRHNVLEEP